jgi:TonB-dependent starch-binding outer membrane protein SusC
MKKNILFALVLFCVMHYSFCQNTINTIQPIALIADSLINNEFILSEGFKITSDNFNKGAIFSPLQLIQGKVSGLAIMSMNGNNPNPDIQVQIRGSSTINLGTNPLYVIDGIPMHTTDILFPDNIESIEVLKSLSETAQYGIRGSNGVILITTKKGHSQQLHVTYSMYSFVEAFSKKSDYLTGSEWRQLKSAWAVSPYRFIESSSRVMNDYNSNTYWLEEISANKLSQAHNFGISGGLKKTSYLANVNFSNYNGIIQKVGSEIYSGQFTVSQLAFKDRLQVDVSLMGKSKKYSQITDNPYLSDSKTYNIISLANRYNPTIPVYNSDGFFSRDSLSDRNDTNPLYKIQNTIDDRTIKNWLIRSNASYEIIKGLNISAGYSEYRSTIIDSCTNINLNLPNIVLDRQMNYDEVNTEKIFNVKLNYNKTIYNHNFDLFFGYAKQGNTFSNQSHEYVFLNKKLNSVSGYIANTDYDIKSILGSANYNYKEKYYLSIGILQEESVLYNWKATSHNYPSFAAGWVLSNENILEHIQWINEIKLNAGYGCSRRPIFNIISGISNNIPNPNVHGEDVTETNVGLDIRLFYNRIQLSAEHYNRKTTDGVYSAAFSALNIHHSIVSNLFDIYNKGWEFNVSTLPILNPVKWTFDFNTSINTNSLSSEVDLPNLDENSKIGDFYGYQFAGYGEFGILIYDYNGNITSDRDFKKVIGNGVPKTFFGLNNSFQYKNFDLSVSMRGAFGFDIINELKLDFKYGQNGKKCIIGYRSEGSGI